MRVVIDTNVFISAAINPHGAPAKVLDAWRDRQYELLISQSILEEALEVIRRPSIRARHGWTDEEIEIFFLGIRLFAVLTPDELDIAEVEDDPDDDKFLVCAVEGAADYIISGDPHLLNMGSYQEIPILNPHLFLNTFSSQETKPD
ncbi:MAG: putative toxin-antitoxin system toxin component, PIN family [Anaerolineales bacterium]|nr:putative toxin-antitoxin system toxin component, PIN family [Anaerolineales bacterium]